MVAATRTPPPRLLLLLLLLSSAVAYTVAAPHHERVWEAAAFPSAANDKSVRAEAAQPHLRTTSGDGGGNSTSVSLHYMSGSWPGYYGEVSLGSPPQRFRMLLSTLLIPTVWIPNYVSSATNRVYNHSRSHTYHANGTPFVMKGLLGGFLSEDELRIGDLVVARQSFVEVTALAQPLVATPFDGMLGLGFETRPGPSQIKMPFHELVDSGALDQPLFAIYLNRQDGMSALTLGATNPRHYTGELAFAAVVRTSSWTAELDGVHAAGQNATKSRYAQFWFEFPILMLGPASDVAVLAQTVGASIVNHQYVLDCDAPGPDIEIMLGGASFAFAKSEYTIRQGNECAWAVQNDMFHTGGWAVGTMFFEKVYTVFHWGDDRAGTGRRMGFALRA